MKQVFAEKEPWEGQGAGGSGEMVRTLTKHLDNATQNLPAQSSWSLLP